MKTKRKTSSRSVKQKHYIINRADLAYRLAASYEANEWDVSLTQESDHSDDSSFYRLIVDNTQLYRDMVAEF